MLMKTQSSMIRSVVAAGVLLLICAQSVRASAHQSRESYYRSGYDYFWSVLMPEFEQREFDTQEQADAYHELIDIMVRTGTGYGHWYQDISLGITQMYPRLLKLDPDPPLYAQYRYMSSVFARDPSPEQTLQLGRDMLLLAQRMHDSGYPPYFEGSAWLRAAKMLSSAGRANEEQTTTAYEKGISLILEAAKLNDVPPHQQEFVATCIIRFAHDSPSLNSEQAEQFCYRLFSVDEIDPWIAHSALGYLMVDKAWDARTDKFASAINKAQWEMFYTYLEVANAHLTHAWEIHPEWPGSAVKLIAVTMGHQFDLNRDEYFWFNEATRVRPDVQDAYYRLAYALRSKWGGGETQLRALLDHVNEVSLTTDHMGYIYISVLSRLSKETPDPNDVLLDPEIIGNATRMFQNDAIQKPEFMFRNEHQRVMRLLACAHFMQGNYEQAAFFLKQQGARAIQSHASWNEPARFRCFMFILAIDESGIVIESLRASDNGDFDTALELLHQFQAQLDMNPDKKYPQAIISRPSAKQAIRHTQDSRP